MLSDDMKKLTKEQKDIIESRRQDIEGIMKVLTVMYTPFIESSDYYSYSPKKLTPVHIGDHNVHIYHELHIDTFGSHIDTISIINIILKVTCSFNGTETCFDQMIPVPLDDDVQWGHFIEYFTRTMNDVLNKMLNYVYLTTTERFFKDQPELGIEDKYFNIVKKNWNVINTTPQQYYV